MEHFNRLTAIVINDVDSCDSQSRSAWLRNSIPTFKVVFISLTLWQSCGTVTPYWDERTAKMWEISSFRSLYFAGRWRRYVHSKRRYIKLPATQRTATQQRNTQPPQYNSPLFYYKPPCLSAIGQGTKCSGAWRMEVVCYNMTVRSDADIQIKTNRLKSNI